MTETSITLYIKDVKSISANRNIKYIIHIYYIYNHNISSYICVKQLKLISSMYTPITGADLGKRLEV